MPHQNQGAIPTQFRFTKTAIQQVRIPMKGATDSNPKPATFSGRKPTTHPHGYRQGQMYAHIVAAWVGASG